MPELPNDAAGRAYVREIIGDISRMEYEGQIFAVACVWVTKDGGLSVRTAYAEGTKLPLLAGTSLLHDTMIRRLQAEPEPEPS